MERLKTIKDYIIISTLGKGSYGIVYKVKNKNNNNIYVIKQIPFDNLSSKEKNEVKQEAKILSLINSIYVVKYYESFEENNCLNIVMEYCDGGDLLKFLEKNKKTNILLKEDLVWKLFLKITIGLAAIHKQKILHRDLKTLNIFLTKDLEIKIGDLGVAKMLIHTKFAKTFIGTPYYLSPELCQDIPYNDKSDVWALGCILYELCTYKHPFEAKSQGALVLKILTSTPSPIHNYYSNDLQSLIYWILEKEEKLRPSCYNILMSPNILEKARQYGLIDKIQNLYPYDNNFDYNYYQLNTIDIYNTNNNLYYYEGNNNNYNNNGNVNYQNNYYYDIGGVNNYNNYYYLNNYNQNNKMFLVENNIHKKQRNKINSNSEDFIKSNIISEINKKKHKENLNQNNLYLDNKKKVCSSFIYNDQKDIKKNNIIILNNNINGQKDHQSYRININPKFIKHNSDKKIFQTKSREMNKKDKLNYKNSKMEYIDSNKYIIDNNRNKDIKELFRNKSNDNLTNNKNINIKFNNIYNKIIKSDNKNNVIKLEDKEKPNNKSEIEINNNQNIIINNKSERKNNTKLLDTITAFANNLNKYVDQHNSAQKLDQNIPSPFILRTNENEIDDLKSEECPKDNIRNKSKNNSENTTNQLETNDYTIKNTDEFTIVNNIENENQKDNNNISNDTNNKEYDYSISLSKKINSTKINSIIENHKNLKILRDKNNNQEEDKENNKEFEEKLYSSEEEKCGNIYDSEEESDSKSEIVKEIKERKTRGSSLTQSMKNLSNEEIKKRLNNERESLKGKVEIIKNDILKLIGEKDFNYIINLYSKIENNPEEVDEIYKKIEEYIKDKYEDSKKEQFGKLYLSLISYDCQFVKKEQQLKKYI